MRVLIRIFTEKKSHERENFLNLHCFAIRHLIYMTKCYRTVLVLMLAKEKSEKMKLNLSLNVYDASFCSDINSYLCVQREIKRTNENSELPYVTVPGTSSVTLTICDNYLYVPRPANAPVLRLAPGPSFRHKTSAITFETGLSDRWGRGFRSGSHIR